MSVAPLPEMNIERLRIAVIDGDELMLSAVETMLKKLGCKQVDLIQNGAKALEFLKQSHQTDILICEWQLPDMTGIELTGQIRRDNNEILRIIPIIFLSSLTTKKHVVDARDIGATEYLAKPVTPSTLYARLCSVILKPRPFIETDDFIGPDRRRFHDPFKVGLARRATDQIAEGEDSEDVSNDDIDAMFGN